MMLKRDALSTRASCLLEHVPGFIAYYWWTPETV